MLLPHVTASGQVPRGAFLLTCHVQATDPSAPDTAGLRAVAGGYPIVIEQVAPAAVRTRTVTCSPRSVVRGALTNTTPGAVVGARVGVGVGVSGSGVCGYTVGAGAMSAAWGRFGPLAVTCGPDGARCVARPKMAPSRTTVPAATAAINHCLPLNRGSRRPWSHDAHRDTLGDIHQARRFRARARPLDLGSASRE